MPSGPEFAGAETFGMYSTALLLQREGKVAEAIDLLETLTAFGDPRAVEAHILLARLYGRSGKGEQALERTGIAVALAPANAEAHRLRGDLFFSMNRAEQAAAAYRRSLELDPDDASTRVRLADLLVNLGEGVAALDQLESAENRGGFAPEIARRRAELLAAIRGPAAAIDYLDTVPAGTYPALALFLATELAALDRGDDAIAALREIVADGAAGHRVHDELAGLYFAKGAADSAVFHFERAAELAPKRPGIRLRLAMAFADAGRPDEAHVILTDLVSRHPDHVRYRSALGALSAELDKLDESKHHFREIVRRHPKNIEAWLGLAALEGMRSIPGTAILERAVALNPESAHLVFLLGAAVRHQDHLDRGEKLVRHAIALGFDDEESWFELGAIRELRGNVEGARHAFERVLSHNPENASALNYIGYMYADRSVRLAESRELIERACELEPDNGYFVDSLGWVYYRLGDLERARLELERAASLSDDDPVILEHLGDVLRDLGEPESAAAAYRRALNIDPTNAALRDRLDEIAP